MICLLNLSFLLVEKMKNLMILFADDFIRPSSDNLEFLVNNKLKIHIETGNIYHDVKDAKKSIFDFLFNQLNPIKGVINFDFVYSESYTDYFNWLIKDFDSHQKNELDVLTCKNSKYLFCHYHDILKSQI